MRPGECEVTICGHPRCAVCKERIESKTAIQLSSMCARVRHIECMPKSDTRSRNYLKSYRDSVRNQKRKRI